jgi:hypothetical protein
LKKIYDTFYTDRAKEIAKIRQKTAIDFYDGVLAEVTHNYEHGLNHHMEVFIDEK